MNPSRKELKNTVFQYAGLGLEMGISVGVGLLFGRYLDNRFHTAPIFFIVGFVIGLCAAAKVLIVTARKAITGAGGNGSAQPKEY